MAHTKTENGSQDAEPSEMHEQTPICKCTLLLAQHNLSAISPRLASTSPLSLPISCIFWQHAGCKALLYIWRKLAASSSTHTADPHTSTHPVAHTPLCVFFLSHTVG